MARNTHHHMQHPKVGFLVLCCLYLLDLSHLLGVSVTCPACEVICEPWSTKVTKLGHKQCGNLLACAFDLVHKHLSPQMFVHPFSFASMPPLQTPRSWEIRAMQLRS